MMLRKKIYKKDREWEENFNNLPKTSKWRALKRGFFWKNYHKQEIYDNGIIDIELSKKVSKVLCHIFQFDEFPNFITRDDISQEIFLRLWRLRGKIKCHDFENYFRIGLYAVKNLKIRRRLNLKQRKFHE